MKSPTLVLTTVNAPHSRKLNATELAHCLVDPTAARAAPGHMSVFFGEIPAALQIEFALMFDTPRQQIVTAAKTFAAYSGENYPLAA